jgi:hypothetical protein
MVISPKELQNEDSRKGFNQLVSTIMGLGHLFANSLSYYPAESTGLKCI